MFRPSVAAATAAVSVARPTGSSSSSQDPGNANNANKTPIPAVHTSVSSTSLRSGHAPPEGHGSHGPAVSSSASVASSVISSAFSRLPNPLARSALVACEEAGSASSEATADSETAERPADGYERQASRFKRHSRRPQDGSGEPWYQNLQSTGDSPSAEMGSQGEVNAHSLPLTDGNPGAVQTPQTEEIVVKPPTVAPGAVAKITNEEPAQTRKKRVPKVR